MVITPRRNMFNPFPFLAAGLLLAVTLFVFGIGSGWITDYAEGRYPRSDCGNNNFRGLLLWTKPNGDADFCVKQSFPQECVRKWVNVYTRRAANNETFDDKMRILKLLDQGIEYNGYVGLQDQVLFDLAKGVIACVSQ